MSRIGFEWEIETQQLTRVHGEDPLARRRRRRNLLRLLLLIGLLASLIGIGALGIRQRLLDARKAIAQMLQDTIKAEVAALRIGDMNAWLQLQDIADQTWIESQRTIFHHYQRLKSEGAVKLSGNIVAVALDDSRARALVQEDIRGLPYARLWFYRFEGGDWLHIAPDFAFWGDLASYTGPGLDIQYRSADQQFVEQLGAALVDWRVRGCDLLDCDSMPTLSVEVLPGAAAQAAWTEEAKPRLRLRSPYVELARADQPFDNAYRQAVSELLANRLIADYRGGIAAEYPQDAYFLLESAKTWLSRWLDGVETGAGLLPSLARNYGPESLADLLAKLKPSDGISILGEVLAVNIAEAELDWSDFIGWRLNAEASLIRARAENDWLNLYDTSDSAVRSVAYQRFLDNSPPEFIDLLDYAIITGEGRLPLLRATVQFASSSSDRLAAVDFRLVDSAWKRAS